MTAATAPLFWRDPALAFIEARTIADGRKVTYTRHSHEHFSIGAVTTGCSYYHYGAQTFEISAGTVVLMNPGDVHACNPIHDQHWSYQMLYIDTLWLTDLQHQLGFSTDQGYRPFNTPYTRDAMLYAGLLALYRILVDERAEPLQKQSALVSYFTEVQQRLNPVDLRADAPCVPGEPAHPVCPRPTAPGRADRRCGAGRRVCRPGAFPTGLQTALCGHARAIP